MHKPLLAAGILIWALSTGLFRLAGSAILGPGRPWVTLTIFAVAFPAMWGLARALCRYARLERRDWPRGALSLAMPTLCFDPFTTVSFPVVLPNMAQESAVPFAALMLWCCAGALLGEGDTVRPITADAAKKYYSGRKSVFRL